MSFTPNSYSKNKTSQIVSDGEFEQRAEMTYTLDSGWSVDKFDADKTSVIARNGEDEQRAVVVYNLGNSGGGSGGGDVTSVNGKKGRVVLTAEDVKATPQYSTMPDASANIGKVVQYTGENGEYKKGAMYVAITKITEDNVNLTWDGYGLNRATVDKDVFISKISESGTYVFTKENGSWTLDGELVNLSDYGISVESMHDYNIIQTSGNSPYSFWFDYPEHYSSLGLPEDVELEYKNSMVILLGDGRTYYHIEDLSSGRSKWESYFSPEGEAEETHIVYTKDYTYGPDAMTYTHSSCKDQYAYEPIIENYGIDGWHRLDDMVGFIYPSDLSPANLAVQLSGVPEMGIAYNPNEMDISVWNPELCYSTLFSSGQWSTTFQFEYVPENNIWYNEQLGNLSIDDLYNYGIQINPEGNLGLFVIYMQGIPVPEGARIHISSISEIQDGSYINAEYTKASSTNIWTALSSESAGIKWDKSIDCPANAYGMWPIANLGNLPAGRYEMFYSRKKNVGLYNVQPEYLYKVVFQIKESDEISGYLSRILGEQGDSYGEKFPTNIEYRYIGRNTQDNNIYLCSVYDSGWTIDNSSEYDIKDAFRVSVIKNIDTGVEYSPENVYLSYDNQMYNEISAYFSHIGYINYDSIVTIPEQIRGYEFSSFSLDSTIKGFYVQYGRPIYNVNDDVFLQNTNMRIFALSPNNGILCATVHIGANLTCELEAATGIFENIKPVLFDASGYGASWGNRLLFIPNTPFEGTYEIYIGTNLDNAGDASVYASPMYEYEYDESRVVKEMTIVSPSGSSTKQISIAGMTTESGFAVPYPTAEEMTSIYNAIVAGNNVQIVDNNNVYYQVMLADSINGDINVEILYFSDMTIIYTLENNTVTLQTKKIGGEETKTATLTANTQLVSNTIYSAGELASITLTLPTVDLKFISEIHFTSGTTPTTFAFPSGNRFDGEDCDNGVFIPVANKRYSIMFFYDGTKVCGLVYGY